MFFSTVLITYLIVDIFKILLAKKLNRKLTPGRIYIMKKGISVMLVVFGIVLISQGAFPGEVNEIREQIDNITPGEGIGFFE